MTGKKRYLLNCEICDTRMIREDLFDGYDDIRITSEILIVNERSRKVLDKYPIDLKVETVLDTPNEVAIQLLNGALELKNGQEPLVDTALIVNGVLKLAPGTEEVLKKYIKIIVNGKVSCPNSMGSCITKMQVNGITEFYPDDCVILSHTAVLDKYFALKARENRRYFAAKEVIMVDIGVDLAALKQKNIHFITPKLLIREEMLVEAISLFDEEVELTVVPQGYGFINGDTILDKTLVRKNGTKLYINGNLTLNEASTPCISELEALQVAGKVSLMESQQKAFLMLDAEYEELAVCRGREVSNKISINVDAKMLEGIHDGLCFTRCIKVVLDQGVTAQQIRELLQFRNCTEIICSKEQKSAVELVSEHVISIKLGNNDAIEESQDMTDTTKIEAESYVL